MNGFEKDIWNSSYDLKVRILDNDIDTKEELEKTLFQHANSLYDKYKTDKNLIGKENINPDIDENLIYGFLNKIKTSLELSLEKQLVDELDIIDISEVYEHLGTIIDKNGEYYLN